MPYIEKHSLDQIQSELGGWLAAPGSEGWLVMYCCCWPSRPFSPFVSCPTATHRSWSPQSSSEMSLFTSFLNWTHRSVFQWVSSDFVQLLLCLLESQKEHLFKHDGQMVSDFHSAWLYGPDQSHQTSSAMISPKGPNLTFAVGFCLRSFNSIPLHGSFSLITEVVYGWKGSKNINISE